MNGETIKNLLEDVCDNIFNEDPFYQQGGDMVRVGGISYTCTPKNPIGKRISNLEIIKSGDKIEPTKTYVVGGWGSVKKNTQGPPMYKLLEKYITRKKLIKPNHARNVKVLGV